MQNHGNDKLTEFFKEYITEHRLERVEEVLSKRTRHLTVVLEDIYQSHNASAVVRSCDCFGVADLHVIENRNTFDENKKVLQGSSKWVNIHKYVASQSTVSATSECLIAIREAGYRLIGTSPNAVNSLSDFAITHKCALVFGTEETGLSDIALNLVDDVLRIDTVGFTESLNISVSAAICLYVLTRQIRLSPIQWQLSNKEKQQLRLSWYRSIIRGSHLLEKEFLRSSKI